MRTTRRLVSLAIGCALAACQGDPGDEARPASGAVARGVASPAPFTDATSTPRVVTLLTGHRVTVRGDRAITVDPPAPGGSIEIHSHRAGEHLYVVPAEAQPLVQRGLLDRRLFDVTELARLGYDDAHRDDLPIIVIYRAGAGPRDADRAALAAAGGRAIRPLESIRGVAMRAPRRGAAAFWAALAAQGGTGAVPALADGIEKVWLDGARATLLDVSAPQIGAPAAWEAGLTGQGVTVAVLDSGIKADHPDFAGRIADSRSFIDGVPEAVDDLGHGTHVASILAGSGAAGGTRYRGVAPDALLLVGKVCDGSGMCPESAIIAGMEWAAESGAAVANLSLGGSDSPGVDPLEAAINALTAEHGTLFVAAAGNVIDCGGTSGYEVVSPGTADAALSVGAVDRDDQTAWFSCRGPRSGDGAIKPDIAAPGVDIVAARAPGTPAGDADWVDGSYARLTGTSMATPHVAGAAALLAQQHPDWRAEELKAALMASATPTSDWNVHAVGTGRVDVERAIATSVVPSPANLHLGSAAWPHDDDEPIAGTVTYRNRGASQVTLQLALDVRDPSGEPASGGMFTVEPAEVSVPAGGEAQVTIIADTRVPGPDGDHAGVLIATSAEQTVRTVLSVRKEVASHDLTVDVIDREGGSIDVLLEAVEIETGESMAFPSSTPVRLRRGTYVVDASFFANDANGRRYGVVMVQPRLPLEAPTTVTFDARTALPVQITIPVPAARRVLEAIDHATFTAIGTYGGAILMSDQGASFGLLYSAQVGPSTPLGDFETIIASIWARHDRNQDDPFFDSPYVYNTSFLASDRGLPTGFVRQVDADDLAAVTNSHAQTAPHLVGDTADHGIPLSSNIAGAWGAATRFQLPVERTSYYLAEGLRWLSVSGEVPAGDFFRRTRLATPLRMLEAGSSTRERWNQAVLGPSMSPAGGGAFIERFGDAIYLSGPSYYSDAANHHGLSYEETGSARLFRDGVLMRESDSPSFAYFTVPPEAADYRLEVRSIRGGGSELSTQVDLAWTFRSSADGDTALPTLAVRFLPALDERNVAPTGQPFVLPITISRQEGAKLAPVERLAVEVSYDRGQRWRSVTVLRSGDHAVAAVEHPRRGGGTVSLRARATDQDGNTVEQTILDAYRLRSDGVAP